MDISQLNLAIEKEQEKEILKKMKKYEIKP